MSAAAGLRACGALAALAVLAACGGSSHPIVLERSGPVTPASPATLTVEQAKAAYEAAVGPFVADEKTFTADVSVGSPSVSKLNADAKTALPHLAAFVNALVVTRWPAVAAATAQKYAADAARVQAFLQQVASATSLSDVLSAEQAPGLSDATSDAALMRDELGLPADLPS